MSSIKWQPTVASLTSLAKQNGACPLIITPFCKSKTLEDMISTCSIADSLSVVVRLTAREVAQGSTDLEIFDLLQAKGYKLYAHPSIHLKLYLFGPNTGFLTSANLTQRGLGEQANRNVEIGTTVEVDSQDWIQIIQLLEGSRLVTAELIEVLKEHETSPEELEKILHDFFDSSGLSMLDLPSSQTPESFLAALKAPDSLCEDELQRYHCDYATYRGDLIASNEDPFLKIQSAFLVKPFIQAFIEHLQSKGSMRFGEVTHWIHNNISERPLPYRSEIKETVSNVYNWLTLFHDQVSWDVPGQRSQVIKWTEFPTNHA
jgi:hypothetical protein